MKKIKLVTVVGTRPEIIRLSRIINKFDEYFRSSVLATKIAELDRSIKNSLIEICKTSNN